MKKPFIPRYLELRYNTWFAVYSVPKNLRQYVGKDKYRKSTKTNDLKLAAKIASAYVLEWKQEIDSLSSISSDTYISSALDLNRQLRKSNDAGLKETIKEIIEEVHQDFKKLEDNYFEDSFRDMALKPGIILETSVKPWITFERNKGLKEKTIDQMQRDIKWLTSAFKTTTTLTRENVNRWIDACVEEHELTSSSIKRIMMTCSNFHNYLSDEELIDSNLINPFKVPKKYQKTRKHNSKNSIESWIPFENEEVEYLYKIAVDNNQSDLANLIYIAAYTGARIEEICSLQIKDVHLKDEYLAIIDSKTKAGIRKVPIHSKLSSLLNTLVSESKDGFLISNLPANKYGSRSGAIGKRFGRLKAKEGFSKLHCFHSIRKTVTTVLENGAVPENVTADILGHKKIHMSYGIYSGGNNLLNKRNAIEKLSFDFGMGMESSKSFSKLTLIR
ncbi:MAG: hypothetical protein CTY33_02875 [Methylotenera sp.]|nr:MAG: hypothetical protein CTY33_02875 [Methylotenera sp.]